MAESFKDQSLSLYMALSQREPELEANLAHIFLDNSIQKDLVNENITEILSYLHRELNNHHIRIEAEVKPQETRQKAYLPREKLEELIKKNPDIKTLTDELGLDLDYS